MLPIQKSPIESFFRFFFIAELNPGQAGLLLSVGNNSPWVRSTCILHHHNIVFVYSLKNSYALFNL